MPEPQSGPNARTAEIAGAARVVIGRLQRRFREQAQLGDLTLSQLNVLKRLDQGPATVTALAQAEGMRPQSMGATIAGLKEAGLVVGEPDPNDGRQTVLSLTEACRQRIRDSRAAREDWLARTLAARLSAAEQEQLAAALDLLAKLSEP